MSYLSAPDRTFILPYSDGSPRLSFLAPSRDDGFLDVQVGTQTTFLSQGESPTSARLVASDGSVVGPEFAILEGVGTGIEDIHLSELDGGGWILAATLVGDPEVFPPRMAVQTLDAAGRPTSSPVVFTNPIADDFRPLPATTRTVDADLDIFLTTGGGLRGDIALWEVVTRPDGTVVVASYAQRDGVHEIRIQVYDASGSAVGDKQVLTLDRGVDNLSLTTGDTGDVLLSWENAAEGGQMAVLAADGTLTHYPFSDEIESPQRVMFSDETAIAYSWQEVMRFPDSDFASYTVYLQAGDVAGFRPPVVLTAYVSETGGFSYRLEPLGRDLFAFQIGRSVSVVDGDGWNYGIYVVIEPGEDRSVQSLDVVDGALVVSSGASSAATHERTYAVFALPTDVDGTKGADNLTLSTASFARGAAGDDVITGSAGNDILDGGAGDDHLMGMDGDDVLRVDRSRDFADGGRGTDLAHVDIFDQMYTEFTTPEALVIADLFALDPDGTLHLRYEGADLTFRSIEEFSFNGYLLSYRSILFDLFVGQNEYRDLSSETQRRTVDVGAGDDRVIGSDFDDTIFGGVGNDQIFGGLGRDELHGGDGDDYINGSTLFEDATEDRADTIYAGSGNDRVFGGYGNDLIFGMDGDDTISGGFGVDELAGQNGNDVITGSAFSDLIFGNAGDDFINGGFGFDRINGGTGADRFYHAGVEGHGSDWIQEYTVTDGDLLVFGGTGATASDFVVRFAHTATPAGERSGDDAVEEAFVNYRGQTLWALVDGAGQAQINIQVGGEVFDLLG